MTKGMELAMEIMRRQVIVDILDIATNQARADLDAKDVNAAEKMTHAAEFLMQQLTAMRIPAMPNQEVKIK